MVGWVSLSKPNSRLLVVGLRVLSMVGRFMLILVWLRLIRRMVVFRGYWSSQGWENGWLGYPVSEEIKTAGGVIQYFEYGKVEWKNRKAYGDR